jgi:hypothetical protein
MSVTMPPPRKSDSWELIPLSEQLANHDEYQPPTTDELAGSSLELHFQDGPVIQVEFQDGARLHWESPTATVWGRAGSQPYEAVAVRPGTYAITVPRLERNSSGLVVVDQPGQRVLMNLTSFPELEGDVAELTTVFQAGIGGPLCVPFEPTTELVGKRVAHRYSSTHAFEHIYLNPNTYAFQGLEGPEAGVADVDRADYWKLGERLYLLSWHERAQPFNGAVVIDLDGGRATGRLVGWERETGRTLQARTGSIATLLSTTEYGNI